MNHKVNRAINSGHEHASSTCLFDREIPDEYLRERTSQVAAKRQQVEVGTQSVVIFRIGTEWLALPTGVVQEVSDYSQVHSLPHDRSGILNGLVNIRGELLLSVSLSALLRLEPPTDVRNASKPIVGGRLLICNRTGSRFAFPVNEVYAVHRYHPKDLRNIPATLAKAEAGTYIVGVLFWGDKSVGCLDDELLFYAMDKSLG